LRDKQQYDPLEPQQLVPDTPALLNDLCLALLCRDPAARLMAAAFRAWLEGESTAQAPSPAVVPPVEPSLVVGREKHLGMLTDAYAATRRGRPVVVLVHGPSGVGKSALVEHFLDGLAPASEAVVLAGRCYEQESVPYKALDNLVDKLSGYLRRLGPLKVQALLPRDTARLARLFPVLRQVDAVAGAPPPLEATPDRHEERRRAFGALRELLARLADRHPLILAIDDLQWSDLDSAALLAEVLRPPDPPALLLLACYRSEDAASSPYLRAFLAAVEKAVASVNLPVEALSELQSRELASSLLGGDDRADLTGAIARESGGNPFFVHELVQHFGSAGPALHGLTLPALLWERVTRLPNEARRLLEILSVSGRPLRQAEAVTAAALEGPPHGPLALLRSGRYTRGSGSSESDTMELYHDRIRETIVARLDSRERAAIHGRLARTLQAVSGVDPEVLGIHFEGAGEPVKASHYYTLAAAGAGETLAFDRSARLYQKALQLHTPEGDEGRRLRARLALALANAGRGAEAAREYLAAAAVAGPDEALDLKRSAADQFLFSGHIDEGLAVLREVLADLRLSMPPSPLRALWGLLWRRAFLRLRGLRFRLRLERDIPPEELRLIDACWAANLSLGLVDPIQGHYLQTRHLLLALRAGEPARVARALVTEAVGLASTGNAGVRRARPILCAAEELVRQIDEPYARGFTLLMRGVIAGMAGRWRLCHDLCNQAEEYFRASCTGVTFELDTAVRFSLGSLRYLGEIAELQCRLPLTVREARERGDLYGEMNTALAAPFLRLAEDDPVAARNELRQSTERWSRPGFDMQRLFCLRDEGQIDLYLGDPRAAWDRLCAQRGMLARSLLLRVQQLRIFMYHIRAQVAVAVAATAANPGPFLKAAERDCRLLEREVNPWATGIASLVRAGVAALRRDRPRAIVLLRAAAERLEALDLHMEAAAARRRLGGLLSGEEGRGLIEQADAELRNRGIVSAARMTAMLASGFPV
jgi:hypothetical protein